MNDTPKPKIAVLRASAHDAPNGCARCQVCGVPVGQGITHCLRCRNIQASGSRPQAPRRTSPLPLVVGILVAGGAAAAWVVARRAPEAPPQADPPAAAAAADPRPSSDVPAVAVQPQAAPAARETAARSVPAPTPSVCRPKPTPRPSTRPVKLTAKCRACGGSGRRRNGSSSRTCPICHGTPVKVRWVSPTHAFCPACSGFGRVMEMRHGTRRATTCRDCRGCGLVKK